MNNLKRNFYFNYHKPNYNTIKSRLVLLISILIATISLFIFLYFPALIQKKALKIFSEGANSIAQMTAYSVAPALYFMDTTNIEEVLRSARQNPDLVFIKVVNDSGRVVALLNQDKINSDITGFENAQKKYIISSDGMILYTQAPIIINSQKIGRIVLGLSIVELRKAINNSRKATAFVSLLILISGITTVIGISALLTHPLDDMVKIFEQIAAGDFYMRANISSSYEVNRLVNSFNKMADRVQVAQNQLELMNKNLEKRVQQRTRELRKEIIQRKKDEERIIASLHEKEVLLKEIHHRVKNNLQIIQSLLYLQSQNIKDKQALRYFSESVYRIRSIALLHEKLYKSVDLARIDFSDYIKDLVQGIYQAFDYHTNLVKFDLNIARFSLSIDSAIPCGLIINELVSNALKHAFILTESHENKIKIVAKILDDKKLFISVQDNGCGMPPEIDLNNVQTLGLRLVNSLVKDQLSGNINVRSDSGSIFEITIKV